MLGKEDGGLPGGIAAAHQHHLRSLVDLRLVVSGGVEYAPPFELFAPFGVQPAILDARGDQQALRGDRFVAGRRMPIRSASSRFDGLRRSSMLLQATTGVSASLTPKPLSRRSTFGSVSTSVQVNSTRFLARKSRTRKVSGE